MVTETNEPSAQLPRVRALPKLVLYVIAWLAALIATDPTLKFAALAYLFPLGLAAFVNLRWGNDAGWFGLGFLYAIYLAHAFFYFRSKTKRSTLLWLGLIILLIGNVSGCRAQLPR